MIYPESYIPYETPAREIAKTIVEDRIPSDFPERFRPLLDEILAEATHDGIEFANGMNEPVHGLQTRGEIYARGYAEGREDATDEEGSQYLKGFFDAIEILEQEGEQ